MSEAAADFAGEEPGAGKFVAGIPLAAFDPVEQAVADLQILIDFQMGLF